MDSEAASGIILTLLLINMLTLAFNIKTVEVASITILVPHDYPTIQAAVDAANSGATIYVSAGIYYERVVVNKKVSLIGENRATTIIDGMGTGTVLNVTSNGVIIREFSIRHSGSEWAFTMDSGIFVRSSDNRIENNVILENTAGISLDFSLNNTLIGNAFLRNNYGILLGYSNNNTIKSNNVYLNWNRGIGLSYSSHNAIVSNMVSSNYFGIYLWNSSNNSIYLNNVFNNEFGIRLERKSENNTLSRNNLYSNAWLGFQLVASNNNTIFHNNITNNTHQVVSFSSINAWDTGYPTGGNYWSDYTGIDLFSGPSQNLIGSDDIGDTPYIIDVNNRDYYPLMNPWTPTSPIFTVTVNIDPDTLNQMSKGRLVTAYMELPMGYNLSDIDLSSIRLNNTIPIDPSALITIGDYNGNGILDMMMKFSRRAITALTIRAIGTPARSSTITLIITGKLKDGTLFQGSYTIKIIK